jgi:hypothetical protein
MTQAWRDQGTVLLKGSANEPLVVRIRCKSLTWAYEWNHLSTGKGNFGDIYITFIQGLNIPKYGKTGGKFTQIFLFFPQAAIWSRADQVGQI